MRRYFDVARGVIEHHGGTVEKFIGDAVMAVFGVPVLHEDDALRAVRAAAGLAEQIAALNGELEADFGATVSIRTGVNTGPVVTGTQERLATGDAVNLAARLEQAAGPGEIVIGPQTWRLVRGAVTAEPLEPLWLKGKSQPVAAYRLVQVRGDADGRAGRAGAPFVGRQGQLQMLGDVFANVAADAAAHLDAAGRRAMDRGDYGAAVNLLERAEALLPPREINLALEMGLVRGLGLAGRLDDALSRAERVAGQCAAAGDRAGELTARVAAWNWAAAAALIS